MDRPQKDDAVEVLTKRVAYAQELLKAVENNQVAREDISAQQARQLENLGSPEVSQLLERVWGVVQVSSTQQKQQLQSIKQMVVEAGSSAVDLSAGRALYKKRCANCHRLFGEGEKIGPELTGSGRANLDYILLNSVDPSYDVPEGYKMVVIQTVDGRVLSGVIGEEDPQRIILKTVEQPEVIILKSDIEDRRVSPKSMMPDGQLDKMKPQEVIDLVGYLQTIEQVEAAE